MGISKTSHSVSHQRTDYEQWSNYNRLFADSYAYFLERLNGMEDVNGENLLDNTMSMLGSCTSQTHVSRNYPLIFSGGGNLGFEHGYYRKYDENRCRFPISLSPCSTRWEPEKRASKIAKGLSLNC